MRAISSIIFSTVIVSLASAQKQPSTDTMLYWEDNQWEKILETAIQSDENTTASEVTTQLEEDPVNLNTATVEELHRIPAISNLIAFRIIERRKRVRFTSINDLLEVEGITPEVLSFIHNFVRIGRVKKESYIEASYLSRTSMEIEKRKGFIDGTYPGSPVKALNRFHISLNEMRSPFSSAASELHIGMLTEKDPGEQNLANFSAFFISFSLPSRGVRVIAGDYQVEDAEGLIFWRASAFGKGSDVIAPARKNGTGIYPYLSSDENSFFRGIGASMSLNKVQIQVLYSNKPINATIDSLGYISSLDRSGLFRTESEQRKQNSSRETVLGFRAVSSVFNGLKIGGTCYRSRFENPFIVKSRNNESVSELWMRGVDASFTSDNVDIFSECALDFANTLAVIAGVSYEPTESLALTISARDYSPAFQSIHGNAFGELSGQVQNENGVYVGIRTQPNAKLSLSTYYDQFEHSQPTYLVQSPSHGNDFLALAEYKFSDQFEMACRFKRKDSPSSISENDNCGRLVRQTIPHIQRNYRMTSEFSSSQSLHVSSRIEWMTVHYGGLQNVEQGVLLFQGLKWNLFSPLTVQVRLVIFETDSFDSAIYEFEDEVPGTYSNPALYGRGMRWYLNFRYQLFTKMYVAAKYGQTVKEGIKSIGNGSDEVSGNSQSLITMQVEVQF